MSETPNRVIVALRRFIPGYLANNPPLTRQQKRAIWAIDNCRTPSMGGHCYKCDECRTYEYRFHSCNHRACPQCGRLDTARWVDTQLQRKVKAPYYMVTFTLPEELRTLFFSRFEKTAYNLFFQSSSNALKEKLAEPKYLGAKTSGFIGVLHTWNQRLLFHPHIHYIVPATGVDKRNKVIISKKGNYLVNVNRLGGAFRAHFRALLAEHQKEVDPSVWDKPWGVNIKNFGNGENAIKYLGAYVCRTAIGDSRILKVTDKTVTFSWKDRANGDAIRTNTLPGEAFVTRYLRHVLPTGMRSIRYYGFMHPAAKKTRKRIALYTGGELSGDDTPELGAQLKALEELLKQPPTCPCCEKPMALRATIEREPTRRNKGPPILVTTN